MEKPKYRSALIVGTGPGLSASLARLFARNGLAVAVAARQTDKLAGARQGDGRRGPHMQRRRSEAMLRRCSRRSRPKAARPTSWSTTPAPGCAGRWSTCRRRTCASGDRDQRLRRLPGLAAGGQAHAAQEPRRDLPDRRHRRREGLRAVGDLRHGQVRAARAGAIDGARAVAQGHPRRAFRDRRRHPQRRAAGAGQTIPTACSIPTPSPRPTGPRCSSTAAPGAGRSRSGRGSRSSKLDRPDAVQRVRCADS